MSSFMGAIAIADLVKTTLGPKGMDKILQSVSGAPPPPPLAQALPLCLLSAHLVGAALGLLLEAR
jgi:T-complex protein 1 subunit beta